MRGSPAPSDPAQHPRQCCRLRTERVRTNPLREGACRGHPLAASGPRSGRAQGLRWPLVDASRAMVTGGSLSDQWLATDRPTTGQRTRTGPRPRGGQLVATHRLIAGRCCPFHGPQRTLSGRGVTAGWPGISDPHSSPATAQVIARMRTGARCATRTSERANAGIRAFFLVFRVSRSFWSSMSTLVQCLRGLVLRSRDIAGRARTLGA